MNTNVQEIDFIKRLADAWDARGHNIFTLYQQKALWTLAALDPDEFHPYLRWSEIPSPWRQRLITAARAGIAFGQVCRSVFE
jgi:hypothetical protein